MPDFYIDAEKRKKIVTKWVEITLVALHTWASALIIAVLWKPEHQNAAVAMFSTCTFGIGATLLILLFDRAADVIINKFGATAVQPALVKETKTTEIIPQHTDPAPVNDVTMNVEGDVNVAKSGA